MKLKPQLLISYLLGCGAGKVQCPFDLFRTGQFLFHPKPIPVLQNIFLPAP